MKVGISGNKEGCTFTPDVQFSLSSSTGFNSTWYKVALRELLNKNVRHFVLSSRYSFFKGRFPRKKT